MGIDFSRVQTFMAKHRLDVANVGTAFEHQRCHRMPKDVACAALADIGGSQILTYYPAQLIRSEG